jgi:hypothetical protein
MTQMDTAHEPRIEGFKEAARPLMKWLAENHHPHMSATVTADTAELQELQCRIIDTQYIKD